MHEPVNQNPMALMSEQALLHGVTTTMTQFSSDQKCAFHGCVCIVRPDEAFIRDGKRFCSRACSKGVGCDHMVCTCGYAGKGVDHLIGVRDDRRQLTVATAC